MKHIMRSKFNPIWIALFIAGTSFAQVQTKTFKETFEVKPEVSIELNTSHANIEFVTWDKNIVEVEAVYQMEGVSKEEAEKFFLL